MSYQVLVEMVPEGLFAATLIGVPDCVAEGATREEALRNASAKLEQRLAKGPTRANRFSLFRHLECWSVGNTTLLA